MTPYELPDTFVTERISLILEAGRSRRVVHALRSHFVNVLRSTKFCHNNRDGREPISGSPFCAHQRSRAANLRLLPRRVVGPGAAPLPEGHLAYQPQESGMPSFRNVVCYNSIHIATLSQSAHRKKSTSVHNAAARSCIRHARLRGTASRYR
jgi:hypothetical protein